MKEILNKRARELRKNATDPENRMWYFLRNRQLNGNKFNRQYAIEPYIVDFICREKKIIVELDGGQHADAISYDQKRTQYLESKGYRVLRFWNNEVLSETHHVLEVILQSLEQSLEPSPIALRAGPLP